MKEILERKTERFDGHTSHEIDQCIHSCKRGGINLHVQRIGDYSDCNECRQQEKCRYAAFVAGEQSEL
jgi:hypothetical protein